MTETEEKNVIIELEMTREEYEKYQLSEGQEIDMTNLKKKDN